MHRVVRALAGTLGTSVVFVTATAGGLVAHMDVPAVRRAVVARVNVVLASALSGRIVIERVGGFGPTHVHDVDARVEDPQGVTVLRVWGLDANVSTCELLRSLVSGPDVSIGLEEVSVQRADVNLDADPTGAMRLARAFTPPPSTAPTSTGGGKDVRLKLPHALLTHVAVHGRPPAGPLIDAYVDGTDASVSVTKGKVALEASHALIVERNLSDGLTTRGTLDARFEQPAQDGSDRYVRASWRGMVGALEGTANGTYDAGKVDAVVDIPSARPECIRDLWASCPFGELSSAHVEVHGALPWLLVNAHAQVGSGSVTAFGQASLGDETRASLHITATAIDAHALSAKAPPTDLAAAGDVMLVATGAGPAGAVVALEFDGGTVETTRVPAAAITGQLERDAAGALTAQANVAVREPGAPVTVAARLSPSGSSFAIAFDASADIPSLDGIARIGPVARGSAQARARGTIDLGTERVDARVDASVASVEAGGIRLQAATLEGHASGPLALPHLDATMVGSELTAGLLHFETLKAQVQGAPTSAQAKVALHGHGADFSAGATIGLVGGTTLHDLRVAVERNGESAQAQAKVVHFGPGEASVEDMEIQGVGAPLHATLRASPGALAAQVRSKGLDLARLGRLAGVADLDGRLALDVDASIRAKSAQGRVTLDLTQGAFEGWQNAQAHVDATLDGLRADGKVTASVGGIGTLEVSSSSLQIGAAGPLEASAWRTAWGEVDLGAHVDLAKLSAQLPKGAIPMGKLSGTVDVKGRVERDSASDSTPEVDVTASTSGLALIGSPVPWRIDGIGATVHTHVDGRSGATTVSAQLADASGPLVALQVTSDAVPYARMFTAAEPVGDALLAMPLHATVTLPSHDVSKLPSFLGTRGMQGMLEASVDWQGSIEKPAVDVKALLTHGRTEGTVLALPVDVTLAGHYDGAHADASVVADARDQRVLDAGAGLDMHMADVLDGGDLAWTASAHATLIDFPLQSLAALDDRQVRGRANGTLQLDGLHQDAKAAVALTLTDLKVGDVECRPTTLNATVDGHTIDAAARIVEQDGYAEAKAHLGSRWGKALVPSADPAQPTDVLVAAKSFRAAVLLPFVSQLFTELDGRIDANVHILIDPVAKTFKPQGTMTLSKGVFELSAMGSELHDASAKVTFTPDGVIRLDSASARGLSGRVQAAASARLQGTELVGAHALVQVSQKEPLPLVIDGNQVGVVDGRVDIDAERAADGVDVKLDVPSLRLQLPEGSTHNVQVLGSLPDVRVGIVQRGGAFESTGLDAGDAEVVATTGRQTPVHLAVHLGRDVEVRRGSDLDVHLDGSPTITVADAVTAKGQIRLTRGMLNVQGKTFKLEDGSTVTFIDDPTNPQVKLTASWAAPSDSPAAGTTVYADFVGPLKTGKVTLRSEPALPQSEILSLLLYGTTDQGEGGSGTAGSQQVNAAGGVAGGAASANINRALGGLNHALDSLGLATEVSTKLDTSQPTPRPEVEVQIARDLSFQIAWVLGVPPPGTNPDQTLFTVAWSFLRQWRAETTVGDAGTTILDLVWQRRY